MSDIFVSAQRREKLRKEMERLGVEEGDLIEKFVLGSGSGGQKINKTASCVYLKHEPTGIELKCQRSRGRELNRFQARCDLCEKLKERIDGEKSRRQQAREKIRRQKKRRTRRQKERMLDQKRKQGQKKVMRAAVSGTGE